MGRGVGLGRRLAELDRRVIGARADQAMFVSPWHRGWFLGFFSAAALMLVNTVVNAYLGSPWSDLTFFALFMVPLAVLSPNMPWSRKGSPE